jgi:hypothetical protein
VGLNGFIQTNVTTLTLESLTSAGLETGQPQLGHFVVFGRVVIQNFDGSNQNASAQLLKSGTVIDRANVRIAGEDSGDLSQCGAQSISLQGRVTVTGKSDYGVSIQCSTYNGLATEAMLFAVLVDTLVPAPS